MGDDVSDKSKVQVTQNPRDWKLNISIYRFIIIIISGPVKSVSMDRLVTYARDKKYINKYVS